MTKINGTEIIEVDTLGSAGAIGRADRRSGVTSFLDIRLAALAALERMGLSRTDQCDFRSRTRRECREHRQSVHRAVVKIKKTDLSRSRKSAIRNRQSAITP